MHSPTEVETTIIVTLSTLRTKIRTRSFLERSYITRIQVYQEQRPQPFHRFVLLELTRSGVSNIWLRLDRGGRGVVPTKLREASNTTEDTVSSFCRFAHICEVLLRSSLLQACLSAAKGGLLGEAQTLTLSEQPLNRPPTLGILQHILRIVCEELNFCGREVRQRILLTLIHMLVIFASRHKVDEHGWLFCSLLQQHVERLAFDDGRYPRLSEKYSKEITEVRDRVWERLSLLQPPLMAS